METAAAPGQDTLTSAGSMLQRLTHTWLNRFTRRPVSIWYSPHYRLPISSMESATGMEPRRADLTAWYLADRRVVPDSSFRAPMPISYAEMARVHTEEYLDSLTQPGTLARILAASPQDVPIDECMHSIRLACGGTLAAARDTLKTHAPAMNLLGGFHHAGRSHGGGFCALNDIAITLAALRAEGFTGRVCVIDVDAHQPDGTAECLQTDPNAWIGSISGGSWCELPNVDEIILPDGEDEAYLKALRGLLARMPPPALAFVVAGGDVLAGDKLGRLRLTLDGVRQRDLMIANALNHIPSVWLPAGGYSTESWRVVAGTAIALSLRTRAPMHPTYDPMRGRYRLISRHLDDGSLGDSDFDMSDVAEALGLKRSGPRRYLGFYTAEGLEHALFRYGVLDQIHRLGYDQFRITTEVVALGERFRLYGHVGNTEYLLVESVLEKQRVGENDVLYVHWLTLRHPAARFDARRPQLPGQEVPGLGMAREAGEMLALIAKRLGLSGVAFRPATFHMAYSARYRFRFVDDARQERFVALIRDLAYLPLVEATRAVSQGRVRLNGEPYTWEADLMVFWLRPHEETAVGADAWHFDVTA
jgi:acetoin utilization deacetylase AcuC-like enzyme